MDSDDLFFTHKRCSRNSELLLAVDALGINCKISFWYDEIWCWMSMLFRDRVLHWPLAWKITYQKVFFMFTTFSAKIEF